MTVYSPRFTLHQGGGNSVDNGGGPPDDGSMERIDQLEKDVAEVKSDIAVIKSNYVTKADLHDSVNGLIKWIVGTAVGLGAAGITIMAFVLNNAIPKPPTSPAAQPAPIVITLPASAAAPAPAALK